MVAQAHFLNANALRITQSVTKFLWDDLRFLCVLCNRFIYMAYNDKIANRIREHLINQPDIDEKEMFGGIAFMINGKMCVGVVKDDLMCRIDPDKNDEVLEKPGCRPMDFTGRPMKGWIFIDEHGMKNKKDLDYWIGLALEFNKKAKKSKKK